MASEEHLDVEASFEGGDLAALVSHLRTILNIQDRKYGFPPRTYPKCFVGSKAVRALVDEGVASDGDDAVHIGNMLLNAGMFHHVQHAHTFEDEYLFYRFVSDEDYSTVALKPDGNSVSLDREAVKIASNNLRYDALSSMITGKIASLTWAAAGGR